MARDDTGTQNGQVTVNESMLLQSPQVRFIVSATKQSASAISTAVLSSVASFLNSQHSMRSMCGVQMLEGSIVTLLPSPSFATGGAWATGDAVNSGAMTSWLLGVTLGSSRAP